MSKKITTVKKLNKKLSKLNHYGDMKLRKFLEKEVKLVKDKFKNDVEKLGFEVSQFEEVVPKTKKGNLDTSNYAKPMSVKNSKIFFTLYINGKISEAIDFANACGSLYLIAEHFLAKNEKIFREVAVDFGIKFSNAALDGKKDIEVGYFDSSSFNVTLGNKMYSSTTSVYELAKKYNSYPKTIDLELLKYNYDVFKHYVYYWRPTSEKRRKLWEGYTQCIG